MKRVVTGFVAGQMRLAEQFDCLLPPSRRVRGNRDFVTMFVPRFLQRGQTIADVGGGRYPLLAVAQKERLHLSVCGIDLSLDALTAATPGCYDRVLQADVTTIDGPAEFDVVICQSLLEHVPSVQAAMRGLASLLRPGGMLLVFVPCRNALYARLNLILPQRVKENLLYAIFPEARGRQGFPSYYDSCTPQALQNVAFSTGFRLVQRRLYYRSTYFAFWSPLHALWRLWQEVAVAVAPVENAETFAMALQHQG